MIIYILIGLALIIVTLLALISLRPSHFRIDRSTVISAAPDKVFDQVDNFHKWENWSPWAKLDPSVKNTYEGPSSGIGSIFTWDGNKQVGAGKMTICESRPGEFIKIKIEFFKPFSGINTVEFAFKSEGERTVVTWSMYGPQSFMGKAMTLIMNCDKMIGSYYEKGLAQLKVAVESLP